MIMNKYEVISEFAGRSTPICHYDTVDDASEAIKDMRKRFPHDSYRIAEFYVLDRRTGAIRYTGRVINVVEVME